MEKKGKNERWGRREGRKDEETGRVKNGREDQ